MNTRFPRPMAYGRRAIAPGALQPPRPFFPCPVRPAQLMANRRLSDEFIRGSISTGILAALQGQGQRPLLSFDQRTLRLALQGGAALAAGTAAVQAVRQGQHGRALMAVAAGAAVVAAAEHFLKEPALLKESSDGQEEQEG